MLNLTEIRTWLKDQVPAEARRATLIYLVQCAACEDSRAHLREQGVSEGALKMLEMARPLVLEQLLKLL